MKSFRDSVSPPEAVDTCLLLFRGRVSKLKIQRGLRNKRIRLACTRPENWKSWQTLLDDFILNRRAQRYRNHYERFI